MSHSVIVKTVQYHGFNRLLSALSRLKSKGVNCQVLLDSYARMYGSRNSEKKFPIVLNLTDSPYDIGFEKVVGEDTYIPVFDPWNNTIRNIVGIQNKSKNDAAHVYKITNEWLHVLAEENAVMNNLTMTSEQEIDGNLIITYAMT